MYSFFQTYFVDHVDFKGGIIIAVSCNGNEIKCFLEMVNTNSHFSSVFHLDLITLAFGTTTDNTAPATAMVNFCFLYPVQRILLCMTYLILQNVHICRFCQRVASHLKSGIIKLGKSSIFAVEKEFIYVYTKQC